MGRRSRIIGTPIQRFIYESQRDEPDVGMRELCRRIEAAYGEKFSPTSISAYVSSKTHAAFVDQQRKKYESAESVQKKPGITGQKLDTVQLPEGIPDYIRGSMVPLYRMYLKLDATATTLLETLDAFKDSRIEDLPDGFSLTNDDILKCVATLTYVTRELREYGKMILAAERANETERSQASEETQRHHENIALMFGMDADGDEE